MREVRREDALVKVNRGEVVDNKGRQHMLIVEFDRRSSPALKTILRNNDDGSGSAGQVTEQSHSRT